jgi:hypothetical protein
MRLLFIFSLLTTCMICRSQNIFKEISFDEALVKSQNEGKLVFIQYESENCKKCNEVADKGIANPELSEKLAATFICIRIPVNHPDREKIGQLYNISNSFGSLFISPDKTLIHKYLRSTTMAAEYMDQIDLALTKAGEGLQVSELEKEYKKGNRSPGFLEMYMQKKAVLNLPVDVLLDEYVRLLPADSLASVRTLRFIATMAPILNSPADQAFRKDRALFIKAWYGMPVQQRVAINNRIIFKSRAKAIGEKDERYATVVAVFASSTHEDNAALGRKSFEINMLEFYKETGDTANYFASAINYYNRYYMSLDVDSIKRVDELKYAQLKASLIASAPPKDSLKNGTHLTNTKQVGFVPAGQRFTWDLNEAATSFYKMTNNPYLLSTAATWVKKGLDIFETSDALQTYSALMYKLGQKQKAIETEQKVIELRKKQGFPVEDQEGILAKMKNGVPID